MHRDDRLIGESARERLNKLLHSNPALDAIYQFRVRLQQIANRTSQGSQDTLEALKQWVLEAEASGIEALQDFARQLQGYVPARVHH